MSNTTLRNIIENMISKSLAETFINEAKMLGARELKAMGATNPETEKRKNTPVRKGISYTSYDLPDETGSAKIVQDLKSMGYKLKSDRSKGQVAHGWMDADYTYVKELEGTYDGKLHQVAFDVDKNKDVKIIYVRKG
tara:strand:- start:121 stop:531 length:411 start_codon:yes stop_codon:yes gene_type:complete